MRISDWSSDVCSSDLRPLHGRDRPSERLPLQGDDAGGIGAHRLGGQSLDSADAGNARRNLFRRLLLPLRVPCIFRAGSRRLSAPSALPLPGPDTKTVESGQRVDVLEDLCDSRKLKKNKITN